MGSYSHYACALLLALAACIHGSSAKLNMNHLCALVNDGLMIASNDACDAYYMCQGGLATSQSCTAGNYFSKESQNCMPQDQVQCLAANNVPCSGYTFGSWAPVTGSCTDFYYCSLNGPERASCPYGEFFNPTTQSCVYPEQYACVVSSETGGSTDSDSSDGEVTITLPLNLCNFIQNGLFFGSASSCNGWNKCTNNVMTSGFCRGELVYNVLTMECEYPAKVTCSQVSNDPYLTSNNCSTKNSIKAGSTCDTYFVCDGSYYQVTQCPSGEFFDSVSNTCVNRLEARNNCDRCQGSTSSFVNMYSASNCTGYLYCLNGVEAASGYCATGSYFDERVGACVVGVSDPILGCCNPAYYSSTPESADGSTTEASDVTTEAAETTEASETTTDDDVTSDASATTDSASTSDVEEPTTEASTTASTTA